MNHVYQGGGNWGRQ